MTFFRFCFVATLKNPNAVSPYRQRRARRAKTHRKSHNFTLTTISLCKQLMNPFQACGEIWRYSEALLLHVTLFNLASFNPFLPHLHLAFMHHPHHSILSVYYILSLYSAFRWPLPSSNCLWSKHIDSIRQITFPSTHLRCVRRSFHCWRCPQIWSRMEFIVIIRCPDNVLHHINTYHQHQRCLHITRNLRPYEYLILTLHNMIRRYETLTTHPTVQCQQKQIQIGLQRKNRFKQ